MRLVVNSIMAATLIGRGYPPNSTPGSLAGGPDWLQAYHLGNPSPTFQCVCIYACVYVCVCQYWSEQGGTGGRGWRDGEIMVGGNGRVVKVKWVVRKRHAF